MDQKSLPKNQVTAHLSKAGPRTGDYKKNSSTGLRLAPDTRDAIHGRQPTLVRLIGNWAGTADGL